MAPTNKELKELMDVNLIAQTIEKLVKDPPPDVVERMQKRLEERRKGMSRGASGEVLSLRVGW